MDINSKITIFRLGSAFKNLFHFHTFHNNLKTTKPPSIDGGFLFFLAYFNKTFGIFKVW